MKFLKFLTIVFAFALTNPASAQPYTIALANTSPMTVNVTFTSVSGVTQIFVLTSSLATTTHTLSIEPMSISVADAATGTCFVFHTNSPSGAYPIPTHLNNVMGPGPCPLQFTFIRNTGMSADYALGVSI